jgi:hypothetical protein
MKLYKTFFIESKQSFKNRSEKSYTFYPDGVALENELEALLTQYSPDGWELHSMESINGSKHSIAFTKGLIVVLHKDKV